MASRSLLSRSGQAGRDLLAWLALAAAVLGTLWPLGLTNRVLAGVDAYTYFTPYWAYRMAALRAGHLPLWDPYLFLGVPFLANPQAAVLYPLHWPLSWLEPAQALIWSALLHVWLAAGFTYAFGRRSLGLSRLAAGLAGLLFGLGGYTLARVENINQLNALAWLPAMLWLYDATVRAADWRGRVRWGVGLAVAVALAVLAGHTQATFIDLAGLALYAAVKLVMALWRPRAKDARFLVGENLAPRPFGRHGGGMFAPRAGADPDNAMTMPRDRRRLVILRLLPFLAILFAVLLAAAQLLPTLELNRLGLRTGGLPYRQAISFSLRPRLLAQTLLPPLGGGLAATFGSEGYAEFAGWLSISALLLAALGLRRAVLYARVAAGGERQASTEPPIAQLGRRLPRLVPGLDAGLVAMVVLAGVGFLLALGVYDPIYYVLWRFVPGFALFRAPARWLALYALGMAGLAGAGLDALLSRRADIMANDDAQQRPERTLLTPAFLRQGRWLGLAAALALLALLAYQQLPRWPVVTGWLAAALATAGLWRLAAVPAAAPDRQIRVRPKVARGALVALAFAEIWLGSRALPYTLATAPAATNSLRNAPAALLAATAAQPPAGRDRFLSLSNIQFDPGDLGDLRRLEGDRLSPDALDRFIRASKQMEVLAPNLSLLLQLPAVDGYDGGILPLDRYVKLQSLFLAPGVGMPPGAPARTPLPDGRLREQLRQIPPDSLLDLTGTRYIITDKQNDLWIQDVYYDLEQAVTLAAGDTLELNLSAYPRFSATTLGIVSYLTNPPGSDQPVAALTLTDSAGDDVTLSLNAAGDTGWAQENRPQAGETIARQWPDWMGPGQDFLALKNLPARAGCLPLAAADAAGRAGCPLAPVSLTIKALPGPGVPLVLRGLTLIDRRTGAHQSITLSPRGDRRRIYSGDVKIYERASASGRAWLVHDVQNVADDAATLARLANPAFDPRQSVILTGQPPPAAPAVASPATAGGDDDVQITRFDAEILTLRATTEKPGWLVLADAGYPGWQATLDGHGVPILRADLLFRAIAVPAGTHEVTFVYQPGSWQAGRLISLAAVALLAAAFTMASLPLRNRGTTRPPGAP